MSEPKPTAEAMERARVLRVSRAEPCEHQALFNPALAESPFSRIECQFCVALAIDAAVKAAVRDREREIAGLLCEDCAAGLPLHYTAVQSLFAWRHGGRPCYAWMLHADIVSRATTPVTQIYLGDDDPCPGCTPEKPPVEQPAEKERYDRLLALVTALETFVRITQEYPLSGQQIEALRRVEQARTA